jgi:hypothetical protein
LQDAEKRILMGKWSMGNGQDMAVFPVAHFPSPIKPDHFNGLIHTRVLTTVTGGSGRIPRDTFPTVFRTPSVGPGASQACCLKRPSKTSMILDLLLWHSTCP